MTTELEDLFDEMLVSFPESYVAVALGKSLRKSVESCNLKKVLKSDPEGIHQEYIDDFNTVVKLAFNNQEISPTL